MSKPWIGVSEAHRSILEMLKKVAATGAEILFSGESGVGKELYARHAHDESPRARKPFVSVNCGAIPLELFENELFGHVGGAFTGARPRSDGLVAEAQGGTLFLDEVDALAPANQVKLLRFLQEKEYRRLGEARVQHADVRIIAATNADLLREARAGRFRQDLLFRLRVVPIEVPPLRERPDDAAALFEAFADWYAGHYRLPRIQMSAGARERVQRYSWPGNVRELENCVRYLTCLQLTRLVDAADLPLLEEPAGPAATVVTGDFRRAKATVVRDFERNYLQSTLERSNGNIAQAARIAGKPRRAFFELMRKHSIGVRREG